MPPISTAIGGSTPQVNAPDNTNPDPLKILDPRQPVTVRPLFASDSEKVTLPYGGQAIGAVHDLAARTLEAVPHAIVQFLADAKSAVNGGQKNTVQLPFDASRLGFDTAPQVTGTFDTQKEAQDFANKNGGTVKPKLDIEGEDSFKTSFEVTKPGKTVAASGAQYSDVLNKSGYLSDPSPENTAKAVGGTILLVGTEILNAFVAGDVVSGAARAGLSATRYSPELEQALQQLGMKGKEVTMDTLKQTFEQKGRKLAETGDEEGWNQLGQATNVVVQHLTGRGVPQLNTLGQLVQDASRLALQDAKYGFTLQHPMAPEIAPAKPVEALPGYRSMEPNAAHVGLRTEAVEPVGRGPEETPAEPQKPVSPDIPETAVGMPTEGGQAQDTVLESLKNAVGKLYQGNEERLAGVDREIVKLKRSLADDSTVPVYLPREAGMTLEPGAEVQVFKPVADNVMTQGALAHRFSVNARDLVVDPATNKVYYNSPEVQSAMRGEDEKPFILAAGDNPTMLIDKQHPEGIEITNTMKEVEKEAKGRFSKDQIADMRGMFEAMRDAYMGHPGRGLFKYLDKNGELPMQFGVVKGKTPTKFELNGENIAAELGYETLDEVKQGLKEAKDLLGQIRGAQKTLRENVRTARDFNALDEARERLLSTYKGVEKTVETARIKSLQASITRELGGTRPTLDNSGVRRGKYTPAIQKKLDAVNSAIKSNREKSIEKALKNVQAHSGAEGTMQAMPEELVAENELLNMAGALTPKGARDIGTEGLEKILDNIRQLKETGQTLRELKTANKREELDRIQAKYTGVVTGGQGLKPGTGIVPEEVTPWWGSMVSATRNYLDSMRGLDFQLEYMSRFDKSSNPLDSVLHRTTGEQIHKARNVRNKGIREWTEKYQDKFGEIFDVKPKSKEFRKEVEEQLKRKKITDITDPATGKTVPLEMNRFELRKKWMELKDQTLRATFELTMGWDSRVIQAVKNAMTPEDARFAEWQLKEFYPSYRESINPVYEDMYGISMGNIPNYSPIKRSVAENIPEYVQEMNAIQRASVKPGSIKSRTQNIAPLEFVGDMQILQQHIIEMEHFKAYAQVISDIRRTFVGPLKTAIQQYHGKEIMRNFEKMVDDLARDGIDWRTRFDFLDYARGNFAVSAMGLNPGIALKQLTSIPAYLTEMPTLPWTKLSAQFWADPLKNARELMDKSEMLKSRYDLGSFDRDVKLAFSKGASADKLSGMSGFKEQVMSLIMLGDKASVLAGGWPVYKYHLDKLLAEGVPQAEAEKKAVEVFERVTKRTQQAGDVEDLGAIQRAGSFGNLFTLFMTSPVQYWRITEAAARNLGLFESMGGSSARGSKASNLKKIFIMWVVLPMLFQFVSDGFQWRQKRQSRAALLGPLGYPVILGDALDTLARKLTGDDVFQDSYTPSALTAVVNAGTTVAKAFSLFDKKTTAEDVYGVVKEMAILGGNAAGVPVSYPLSVLEGLYDLSTGKSKDPRRVLFSDYALDTKSQKKTPPVGGGSSKGMGALNALNRLNKLTPSRLAPKSLDRLNSLNKLRI